MTGAYAPATSKLYTPRMLMLSARLADYPLTDNFSLEASARSKTCGSTVNLGLDVDATGHVTKIGLQITACAVGQSSAAILADGITGRDFEAVCAARDRIADWLVGAVPPPDWPGFDALHSVREYTGRHGALLLPWNAAIEALSSRAATS